jgi:hypothetical protein
MGSINTPTKTDQGWVVDIPAEITKSLGVAVGSVAVMHAKDGNLAIEILPPPSPELLEEVRETYEELKDTFAELKRLGD